MAKREFVKEHQHLEKVLKHGTKEERHAEAKKQGGEARKEQKKR
jgi:hypothetical protein